jgi:hypothetical protein
LQVYADSMGNGPRKEGIEHLIRYLGSLWPVISLVPLYTLLNVNFYLKLLPSKHYIGSWLSPSLDMHCHQRSWLISATAVASPQRYFWQKMAADHEPADLRRASIDPHRTPFFARITLPVGFMLRLPRSSSANYVENIYTIRNEAQWPSELWKQCPVTWL